MNNYTNEAPGNPMHLRYFEGTKKGRRSANLNPPLKTYVMPKYDYTGTYSRTGNTLEGEHRLLIAKRPPEKVTPNKPSTYLLEVQTNGQRTYLSSLYPTPTDGVFRMEKGGTWYLVNLGDAYAHVTTQTAP